MHGLVDFSTTVGPPMLKPLMSWVTKLKVLKIDPNCSYATATSIQKHSRILGAGG